MKENIKEDIKNIEEIIELSKEEIDAKDENITAILDIEDLISLEHILSDYKRVLKENEELLEVKVSASANNRILELEKENKELKEENEYNKILLDMNNNFTIDKKTRNYKWNVIEIQKVKDKIEELNNNRQYLSQFKDYKEKNYTNEEVVNNCVEVLQELLESE